MTDEVTETHTDNGIIYGVPDCGLKVGHKFPNPLHSLLCPLSTMEAMGFLQEPHPTGRWVAALRVSEAFLGSRELRK